MLAPGDMFVLPAVLNWRIFGNSRDRASHVCTVIACDEESFGTQGRTYRATLLVGSKIVGNCKIQESKLDEQHTLFIHRAG